MSTTLIAQVPPRFYWKTLAGAHAVPVIYQSLRGNANPLDPSHRVNPQAAFQANVAIVGYAKMLPLFGRSSFAALLLPVGNISADITLPLNTVKQFASGFGDLTLEIDINVLGAPVIKNLPGLLRYQPKLSIDFVMDIIFPIGEYNDESGLNLGQNRWYGKIGAPIVWQIGPWIPRKRTTIEALPSLWVFGDNKDFLNQNLSTDPKFLLETHVTRDFAEYFWGSVDFTYVTGGKSSLDGFEGESVNILEIGGSLGYYFNDNIQLIIGYLTTINDNDPTDLSMDGYKITLVYGWHKIIEGMNRLKGG